MLIHLIALFVPSRLSENVAVATIDARHPSLQIIIGGELECIARGDWQVYLNAQAQTNGPSNVRAVQLLHETGLDLPVTGNAVFLGRAGLTHDTDVPEYLIRRAETLFDTRLAQPAA
ncbi:hypothetical protein [Paenarthrobacter aromaticivorans]|uniref:DUF3846 domain-containing protein n=1 Tax=Paenarthrobacter aromaticivorans TaxID=2849150 RepID=A0ABS6IBV3_9MICC|nr:hypothetical protein [Paenarthrobacter sp. MMS21-TAE1-1]MBU8869205.1 hypothetical protein [Paenarthrobacter sp. MMS21-TAE1-1]